MEIGFIHGRFQIFHNEHLEYALAAKKRCEVLIVGITSPDNAQLLYEAVDPHRSNASANPFTYYERFQMIKAALLEAGLKREEFEIVPFPIETPDSVQNYIPLEATAYLTIYDNWGEEKFRRLSGLGYNVCVLWRDRAKKISSTNIRNFIMNGQEWSHLVPSAVYSFIQQNNLDERISNINE